MKRLFIIAILTLAATVAAANPAETGKPLSVHTFQFKYKDADRAAVIIKPLLSPAGSMSIQPSTNALVVTDRPENVKAITAALGAFDVAPRQLTVSVRLVAASKAPAAAMATPTAELKDVYGKLSVLGYQNVEDLGEATLEGHEGDPGQVDLATGYRAEYKFGEVDINSDSLKLNDFKVSRLQKDQLVQLYKASLNLKIGQPLIFGVTRGQGQRALFLVFVAHR